jgi:hypothetical protein
VPNSADRAKFTAECNGRCFFGRYAIQVDSEADVELDAQHWLRVRKQVGLTGVAREQPPTKERARALSARARIKRQPLQPYCAAGDGDAAGLAIGPSFLAAR